VYSLETCNGNFLAAAQTENESASGALWRRHAIGTNKKKKTQTHNKLRKTIWKSAANKINIKARVSQAGAWTELQLQGHRDMQGIVSSSLAHQQINCEPSFCVEGAKDA
jgi:hypothetical protein